MAKGYYLKKDKHSEDIFLFIKRDEFIQLLNELNSPEWLKFRIYANEEGAKFSHNIEPLNKRKHE